MIDKKVPRVKKTPRSKDKDIRRRIKRRNSDIGKPRRKYYKNLLRKEKKEQ